MSEESKQPAQQPSHGPVAAVLLAYRWPIVFLAAFVIALVCFLMFLKTGKQTFDETASRVGQAAEKIVEKAGGIAEKFKQGTITETFTAAIPSITGTGMGNLELATARAVETFTRSDRKSLAWDTLNLGTTVTEIKVPVTYRYHLNLRGKWNIEVNGNTCIVTAPKIRPSLPPAIHTDRMEKKSDRGWARFNEREQMEELQRNITPALIEYALDGRHLSLVREECRKTVAEFVKNWLLQEEHWRKDRFSAIKVVFADEEEARPEAMEPTLRLED